MPVGLNDQEEINAVIPLFDENDQDLKPFITSSLFHILMTFNVIQNVDTCFYNAYVALQANAL